MNNTQKWLQADIRSNPESKETIEYYLFELGSSGLQEEDNTIVAYFEGMEKTELQQKLEELFNSLKAQNLIVDILNIKEIKNQNWNENWKDAFKPIQVTNRLTIKPPWLEDPHHSEFVIDINPKMAFGTGTHETTQLCLKYIDQYLKSEDKVLDLGTGSGILSVAAIKYGAQLALGVDIDEACIENADENSLLNYTNKQTEFKLGGLESVPPEKYDFILANINRKVLEKIIPELALLMNKETKLIISGVLIEETEKITETIQTSGLAILETQTIGEWIGLVVQLN